MSKDLEYFKKKVIEILKSKEEVATGEVKKSLDSMDYVYGLSNFETMGDIEKAGYGVGTIRIWRGKKYKKVSASPTRWIRVYDKVDRGAKSSMTRLINKADACQSIDELLQFCMSNHAIFKDANGVDLPILDELRKAVDEKKTRLENGDTSSIRPEKKPASKKDNGQNAEKEKYKNLQNELKADDIETTKAELKKIEKLFDEYISGYNHGAGYWLRSKKGDDAHDKAFMRARGIPYLIKAKEALEAEGYKMPEIPKMLLDKYEEYKDVLSKDTGYFKTAGDKILSGIRQSVFDDIIEEFKKPLQEKYKELKDKLPKVEDGSPKNNPPVAGKTNKEQAEMFDTTKDDSGNTILTYNGKPYAKITGYGSLGEQRKMVEAAGMEPKAQIDYVRNENDWNNYWIGIDSSLKKYGEKKIKELAETPVTSDEEFYSKLEEACTTSYKDYGYILRAVSNHEYEKLVAEKAKKIADRYNNTNNAINDVDLPVDPKDMDEAESIIGRKVRAIAGRSDTYGKSLYRSELKKMIEARIRNNPAVARAMLVFIKNYQTENNVVIFTPKNEIWDQLPKLNENAMNAVMNGETETKTGSSGELYSGDGISSVVENKDIGRYQITFTGKPDYETRTLLKQNGFRWAPSTGTWQCYNTANGERSLQRVAEALGWNKNE